MNQSADVSETSYSSADPNAPVERDDSTTQPSQFVERGNSPGPTVHAPAPRSGNSTGSTGHSMIVQHPTVSSTPWHLFPTARSTSTGIRSNPAASPSINSGSSVHTGTSRGGFGSTGHAAAGS